MLSGCCSQRTKGPLTLKTCSTRKAISSPEVKIFSNHQEIETSGRNRKVSQQNSGYPLYACSETFIELERVRKINPEPGFSWSGLNLNHLVFSIKKTFGRRWPKMPRGLRGRDWQVACFPRSALFVSFCEDFWSLPSNISVYCDWIHYSQRVLRCLLSIICILFFIFSWVDICKNKIIRQQRQAENFTFFWKHTKQNLPCLYPPSKVLFWFSAAYVNRTNIFESIFFTEKWPPEKYHFVLHQLASRTWDCNNIDLPSRECKPVNDDVDCPQTLYFVLSS